MKKWLISVLVIFVIVVVIAAVLVIFVNSRSYFRPLRECEDVGGSCSEGQTFDGAFCKEGYYKVPRTICDDKGTACCVQINP